MDLRHSEYVGVHNGVIRDVCFSPRGDGMVLTASMDKSIRLTSMQANAMVQRSVLYLRLAYWRVRNFHLPPHPALMGEMFILWIFCPVLMIT